MDKKQVNMEGSAEEKNTVEQEGRVMESEGDRRDQKEVRGEPVAAGCDGPKPRGRAHRPPRVKEEVHAAGLQ